MVPLSYTTVVCSAQLYHCCMFRSTIPLFTKLKRIIITELNILIKCLILGRALYRVSTIKNLVSDISNDKQEPVV